MQYDMSDWPSGLRRQTQGLQPSYEVVEWDFWSMYVGVGSNPTSDNFLYYINVKIVIIYFTMYTHSNQIKSKIIYSHIQTSS